MITFFFNNIIKIFTSKYIPDTLPPVVHCPENIDQFADPGKPSAVVTWNPVTATDNSGSVASLTSDHMSGSTFNIGAFDVTYTATDGSGNVGTCQFRITVIGKSSSKYMQYESKVGNDMLLASDNFYISKMTEFETRHL